MSLDLDIFKIIHNDMKPARGRILISEPFLQGYYFSRSIILITEHNKEGSMGVVLNKRLEVTASDLIKDFPLEDVLLRCGGPVSPDRLYYIHSFGDVISGSIHIKGNLYFGGDFSNILELLNDAPALIKQISFYVGYAGWAAGQLVEEIDENSWLVAELPEDQILTIRNEDAWKRVVSGLGKKYRNWMNYPQDPIMN